VRVDLNHRHTLLRLYVQKDILWKRLLHFHFKNQNRSLKGTGAKRDVRSSSSVSGQSSRGCPGGVRAFGQVSDTLWPTDSLTQRPSVVTDFLQWRRQNNIDEIGSKRQSTENNPTQRYAITFERFRLRVVANLVAVFGWLVFSLIKRHGHGVGNSSIWMKKKKQMDRY